jgi:hypothetical protein
MKNAHRKEFRKELALGRFEVAEGGILFTCRDALAKGVYFDSINGVFQGESPNLIVDQGLMHMLNVVFGATSKAATWYLALYAGAISPAANWTAANFASTATEITSNSEGYSDTTRREWIDNVAAANAIDNVGSEATFNIECASSININGAALLSDNTKGGTSGVLASATRYGAQRTLYDGDVYKVGYRVSLTG